MRYNYSICHPEKGDIEYPEVILTAADVKHIALNYPWKSELQKMNNLDLDKVHYNPSLDFINQNNHYSFCLTAEGDPDNFSFSVWYNRPKMKKVLFGLLGEKEKFEVIDKPFSKEDAFRLLDKFLMNAYQSIENEMNKK